MSLNERDICAASIAHLESVLLTVDGQGKEFKRKVLNELLDRAKDAAWSGKAQEPEDI